MPICIAALCATSLVFQVVLLEVPRSKLEARLRKDRFYALTRYCEVNVIPKMKAYQRIHPDLPDDLSEVLEPGSYLPSEFGFLTGLGYFYLEYEEHYGAYNGDGEWLDVRNIRDY